MDRLSRRNLFKAALGTVGAAVVGKAAPEPELTFTPGAFLVPPPEWQPDWVQYHQHYIQELAKAVWIDRPQPIRADEAWSASMDGTRHGGPLSAKYVYGEAYTDLNNPSIWSTSDALPLLHHGRATLTKHTAGPDGEVITNGPQPYLVMNAIDGWEEGEGFDG